MQNEARRIVITAGIDTNPRNDTLDALRARCCVKEALTGYGYEVLEVDIVQDEFSRDLEGMVRRIGDIGSYCVFNLFEGFADDAAAEAVFVRAFEKKGIKFTGNGSATLEVCLDKSSTKKILSQKGIKVPPGITVYGTRDVSGGEMKFPVFIKPVGEDASVGIDSRSFIRDEETLYRNIKAKLVEFPRGLIVEEFMPGREINVGFMGDYPYELVGVSVLDYSQMQGCAQYIGYSAKWKPDSEEYSRLLPEVVTRGEADITERAVDISRAAAAALGCRGYFRVDLREKERELYVLDVNPNPDITPEGGFMRQGCSGGASYGQIINSIVKYAVEA